MLSGVTVLGSSHNQLVINLLPSGLPLIEEDNWFLGGSMTYLQPWFRPPVTGHSGHSGGTRPCPPLMPSAPLIFSPWGACKEFEKVLSEQSLLCSFSSSAALRKDFLCFFRSSIGREIPLTQWYLSNLLSAFGPPLLCGSLQCSSSVFWPVTPAMTDSSSFTSLLNNSHSLLAASVGRPPPLLWLPTSLVPVFPGGKVWFK